MRRWLALVLVVLAAAAQATPGPVRFAAGVEPDDRRFLFATALLQAALDADGGATVTALVGMDVRARLQAVRAGRADVTLANSALGAEQGLLPVRFPLRRGLLGVRLLVARPETAARLARVQHLDELQAGFRMAYHQQWMDAALMQQLGFRPHYVGSYRGVFDAVRNGQADYASRGVSEVFDELAQPRHAQGLVVVPGIALVYPLDDYFHVAPANGALRERIARGLDRLRRNGGYQRLFGAHFGAALQRAGLEQRRLLHVPGYPVPPGTPLALFDALTLQRSRATFNPPTPP